MKWDFVNFTQEPSFIIIIIYYLLSIMTPAVQ